MDKRAILLHPDDNVATAISDLEKGDVTQIAGKADCVAVEQVPFGHKIALKPISAGQAVIKYSKNIGLAAVDIEQGSCVHTHNIESQRGRGDRDGGKK
jgi:altronate dehydratase small subunit